MALCEPWADTSSLCFPCSDADYSIDSGLMDEFLQAASDTLFILSGQQFPGECAVEGYRPCSSSSNGGTAIPYRMTAFPLVSSTYGATSGCHCSTSDNCSCPPLSEIELPFSFVTEVSEVKVDGDILPDTDYRLDMNSLLVSTTDCRWSCCQNMRLPDTETGTWSVALTHGRPPPILGIRAAAILACEFYMACQPEDFEGQCRLPRSITSVARQGVTVLVSAVADLYTPHRGRPVQFGIPEIDAFLATTNPHGLTAPMVFLSPDDGPLGRIVG